MIQRIFLNKFLNDSQYLEKKVVHLQAQKVYKQIIGKE